MDTFPLRQKFGCSSLIAISQSLTLSILETLPVSSCAAADNTIANDSKGNGSFICCQLCAVSEAAASLAELLVVSCFTGEAFMAARLALDRKCSGLGVSDLQVKAT